MNFNIFLWLIEINIIEFCDVISRLKLNMFVNLFVCVNFCYLVRFVEILIYKVFLIIVFVKFN